MDNAVITVKKGQSLCIICEGYEDHAATFDYEDVFGVIISQMQQDLNKKRNEKFLKNQSVVNQGSQTSCGQTLSGASGLGLYPR